MRLLLPLQNVSLGFVSALIVISIFVHPAKGSVLGFLSRLADWRQPRELSRPCNFLLSYDESGLAVPDIVPKYDLPFEIHSVTSEDGYIVDLHRIPAVGKPPVYLISGFLLSSREFLLNCERRALAIKLHDSGYDVWIGNIRGNAYARKHVNLTTRDSAYWDFGVDEVAQKDTPAAMDYILRESGFEKLNWVGYSMGNAIILGLLSSRPEYNAKINLGFAMGAAAVLTNTRSPPIRLLAPYGDRVVRFFKRYARGEVIPHAIFRALQRLAPRLCRQEIRTERFGICAYALTLADGPDPLQVDARVMTAWFAGFPNPIPAQGLAQWLQWITSGNVSHYDFGREGNLKKYNRTTPLPYDLNSVQSPIVLFYAENDYFTTAKDVNATIPLLPSIQKVVRVDSPTWNHMDYIVGRDADIKVYDIIIDHLNKSYNIQ